MPDQHTPAQSAIPSVDQAMVLSALESDQLAEAKKRHIPRRRLTWPEILVLSALRIYLLFMMAVVAYQVWAAVH